MTKRQGRILLYVYLSAQDFNMNEMNMDHIPILGSIILNEWEKKLYHRREWWLWRVTKLAVAVSCYLPLCPSSCVCLMPMIWTFCLFFQITQFIFLIWKCLSDVQHAPATLSLPLLLNLPFHYLIIVIITQTSYFTSTSFSSFFLSLNIHNSSKCVMGPSTASFSLQSVG